MARKIKTVKLDNKVVPASKTPVKNTFIERREAHMINDPLRVVFSTAPAAESETLALKLLQARLVACVNLVPSVASLYWWEGKIERSAETLLILKTPASKINALRRRLRELHSYSVPEFLALQVLEVNPAYAKWAAKETGSTKS